MIKILPLIFVLLLVGGNSFSQTRKLAVNDFKGETDERSFYLARTYTVISLRYADPVPCKTDRNRVQLLVETGNRLSDKSWIKSDRVRNKAALAELLSHEQGHFDIGEVFALDLKSRLSQTCFSRTNYRVEADSVFRAMNKRYDALQQQYDFETNNMLNTTAQAKWKKKIETMLAEKGK